MVNDLTESYLGYAHAVAAKFVARYFLYVIRDDVNGAAELGLVQAARNFDPSKGASFETFAYYRIRGAIIEEVRRSWHTAHIAITERQMSSDPQLVDKQETRVEAEPRDCRFNFRSNSSRLVTIGELDNFFNDARSPANYFLKKEESEVLTRAIHQLPERHRLLIEAHYFKGISLANIGKRLKLSRSWVSRMHKQALTMVRLTLQQDSRTH
jgi:RNA polymerase sigma factor FliA